MAALSEEAQLAQAIAASLVLNNAASTASTPTPTAAPSAPTTEASTATSTGEKKEDDSAKPKKKGKPKILRFIHANGLHRMTKIVFETMTLKNLKIRIVDEMQLRVEPKDIILKMEKESDVAWVRICSPPPPLLTL
jgi:hypothetical protein